MNSSKKSLPALRIHTNIPSPYRKHQFERLAQVFSNAKFYFYTEMDVDRPWLDELEKWKINWSRFRRTITFGRLGKCSIDLVVQILRDPKGTIHLVGCGVSMLDWCLLCLLGFLRCATIVHFNDGGFKENISIKTVKRWHALLKYGCWRMYTPGKIGQEYGLAFGFKSENIYNSYFSHDVKQFEAYYLKNHEMDRDKIRLANKIQDSQFVVLTISRFIDWKRIEDAASALYLLEKDNPGLAKRITYILVGEGESLAHESILDKLSLIQVVHLQQMSYDNILAWYCAADLFLLPSEGDIWGLVVNEALSMRLPVICTERIGASELIKEGTNGYIVPARSPKIVQQRITECFEDVEKLAKMKKSAGMIVDQWNTEKGIQELLRLCSDV
jgi:glycosyltransferase involved in cell wall biosynthesis